MSKDILTLKIEGALMVEHHRPAILVDKDGVLWVEEEGQTNVCHPVETVDIEEVLSVKIK